MMLYVLRDYRLVSSFAAATQSLAFNNLFYGRGGLVLAMGAMWVVVAATRRAADEVVVGALVSILVPVVGLVVVAAGLLLLLVAAGAALLLLLLVAVGAVLLVVGAALLLLLIVVKSEQGAESIHAKFNRLGLTFAPNFTVVVLACSISVTERRYRFLNTRVQLSLTNEKKFQIMATIFSVNVTFTNNTKTQANISNQNVVSGQLLTPLITPVNNGGGAASAQLTGQQVEGSFAVTHLGGSQFTATYKVEQSGEVTTSSTPESDGAVKFVIQKQIAGNTVNISFNSINVQ
eukprot:Em0105g12a